jgi:hypothetical protein
VQVTAGGLTSNSSEWFSSKKPEPTLDSATRTDKAIYLKGKDLINLSKCDGNKISFQLTQGTTVIPLTVNDWNNGEPELVLPDAAKTGTWTVEVLLNGGPVKPTAVTKELKPQVIARRGWRVMFAPAPWAVRPLWKTAEPAGQAHGAGSTSRHLPSSVSATFGIAFARNRLAPLVCSSHLR